MLQNNTITPAQAQWYAHLLQRRAPSSSVEKFSRVLADATVEPLPHQIDGALFAFQNPLSKGAILADEVGLGKTIEAGLILAQKWAEAKRNLLVICPAPLRQQWSNELQEKFGLPSLVMASNTYKARMSQNDVINPFDTMDNPKIVLCSYEYASSRDKDLATVDWDLVVFDEAHRLRNVYKGMPTATKLKTALADAPKVLLTATPLQNNLLELYGLVSIIDDEFFGSEIGFKNHYMKQPTQANLADLRERLSTITNRTLRKDVQAYIKFTNRIALTQTFVPTQDEQRLYRQVTEYLRQPNLHAIASTNNPLIILVLQKLLASSSFAIASTLEKFVARIEKKVRQQNSVNAESETVDVDGTDDVLEDFEVDLGIDPTDDEQITTDPIVAAYEDDLDIDDDNDLSNEFFPTASFDSIDLELKALKEMAVLARSITHNKKADALLQGINQGFTKISEIGGPKKALIFTESVQTQRYLYSFLSQNGFAGKVATFNGQNNEPHTSEIFTNWRERHKDTSVYTGNRSMDIRSAIVEHFKDEAEILIATESAGEGMNLQFCSLLINYDLPWNPQRVEQRIGRVHRYGQKYDVVVVNFINETNAADARVYELLDQKFGLFTGVLGASDQILGALENGADFEKLIAKIYRQCRTDQQITKAFDQLQLDLEDTRTSVMSETKEKIVLNFDKEVHDRLKITENDSKKALTRFEKYQWEVLKHVYKNHAVFEEDLKEFTIASSTLDAVKPGRYSLVHNEDMFVCNYSHPLVQNALIELTITYDLPDSVNDIPHITFDYSSWENKVTLLEPYVGQSGFLAINKLTLDILGIEDHFVIACQTDQGEIIATETAQQMLEIVPSTQETYQLEPDEKNFAALVSLLHGQSDELTKNVRENTGTFLVDAYQKLDDWAEDIVQEHKANESELEKKIKELKKVAKNAATTPERISLLKQTQNLDIELENMKEKHQEERKSLAEDKSNKINSIEKSLEGTASAQTILITRFTLI